MHAPTEKRCFKCGEVKVLSAFYKHPQMADGHVNKCKECNKKDVTKNRLDNLDYVQEYDRNRRKKANVSEQRWEELSTNRKIYSEAYYKENPDLRLEKLRRYREANPKKYKAHCMVARAIKSGKLVKNPCEVCGDIKVHGHHCDYDKPLEVVWLCAEHHSQWHSENGEGLNADNKVA